MADELEDDLFRKSTMSFGEHLDELRIAFLRSAVCLAITMLIATPFADDLVVFVERPLTRALGRLELARGKLLWQGLPAENASLSDMLRLGEERLIPRRMRFDPHELRAAMGLPSSPEPAAAGESSGDASLWPPLSLLASGDLPQMLLASATSEPPSPFRELWQQLTPAEQAEVASLSEVQPWDEAAARRLGQLLSGVARRADLKKEPGLWEMRLQLPKVPLALLNRIQNTTSLARVVDRNVLLLHAAFPTILPLPNPPIVDLTVWETSSARLQSLNAPEPFMIWMKALVVLGVVLASPWIFYYLWNFVASGLYRHERKLVHVFVPVSLGLFFAGASLAFFFVFDPVLDFLLSFNLKMNIDMQPRVSDWMGFVLLLPLGFGISFQLPLVMLVLERLGIVTVKTYLSHWRFAVMIIFVISSVLTPADPLSLLFMAVPLTFLYFGGIWFCRFNHRPSSPLGPGIDP